MRGEIDPYCVALKALLDEKGHGAQSWLARKVGVTPQAISAIAKGQSRARAQTRSSIAKAFGKTAPEMEIMGVKLIGGVGGQQPEKGSPNRAPPWLPPDLTTEEQELLARAVRVLRSGRQDLRDHLAMSLKQSLNTLELEELKGPDGKKTKQRREARNTHSRPSAAPSSGEGS